MAKYFKPQEIEGLSPYLISRLDALREEAGIPVVITEGVPKDKTGSHVQDSAHFDGKAVDIRVNDSNSRFKLMRAAFKVGFTRIGVYDKHLHLDVASNLPPEVTWVGVSK